MKLSIIWFLLLISQAGTGYTQGKPAPFPNALKAEMCEKIKAATRKAWAGYKQYAWGADDLKPLSRTGLTWYDQPLLMTPVDAFDTFIIMGLTEEAHEAKELILSKLNFNTNNNVQVFEVTIRILAGLITAFETDGEPKFLLLATDLADRMMPAFKTPTGMPYRYVHMQTGATADSLNNPAEIGSLMLEFGKLSTLTGNNKYYTAAKKAIMAVYSRRSEINLVGEQINVVTGQWTSTQTHISGYIDSYYEYLYKSWLLFGDPDFKKAFEVHNAAIKKYLLAETNHGTFLRHADMYTGKETGDTYGALDAFYAGLCAYAGDTKTAVKIQRANFYMWNTFNLEPEEFHYKTDSVTASYYVLRPENLESCFYLYRSTQQNDYLFMAKVMIESILKYCKAETGFAALKNVKTFEQMDAMQSFFLAETLKYAYLVFAPESAADLKKIVFNTEAHPLKIKPANR